MISATSPDSRSSVPSAEMACCQRFLGILVTTAATSALSGWPTMKRTPRSWQASMNLCEQPAESARAITSLSLWIDRQLGQGVIEHDDVIIGVARCGVARPQSCGQRLTGGVEEGHERGEPEPVLVIRGCPLFVRMRTDQRGVEVDHVETRIQTGRPGFGPRRGPRRGDALESGPIDRLEGPPGRGHRGHVAEEGRLIGQHPQVADGGRAVRNSDGQIDEHLAPVMASASLLGRRHRLGKPLSQPELVGQFAQQASTRMSGDTLAAGGHHNAWSARVTLHLGSALLVWFLLASQSTVSLATRAFPRQYDKNVGPFIERSGLGPQAESLGVDSASAGRLGIRYR